MRIGLFVTCLTDTLFPATGQAMVAVLERLDHQVDFPAALGGDRFRRTPSGNLPGLFFLE